MSLLRHNPILRYSVWYDRETLKPDSITVVWRDGAPDPEPATLETFLLDYAFNEHVQLDAARSVLEDHLLRESVLYGDRAVRL